jgi:tRNA pseudouridine13 synthase
MSQPVAALPYAHGGPTGTATLKAVPEDFRVEEILGFQPSGEGEHVFLKIEKRGENTDYLARQLARFAGISPRNVGYAGLKDRHGVTVQWFSVQLPGQAGPDWATLESPSVRVLETTRNLRKLKKGAAAGNRFEIALRHVCGERGGFEQRLRQIAELGVPNYFGAQRFGREGQNLARASELFAGTLGRVDPHRRGLYLSAARSEIFNRILARRVAAGTWNQAVEGDACMFPDSRSFFKPEALTPEIQERLANRDVHPSGPLWGREGSAAVGAAAAVEQAIVEELADYCRGLERFGLEAARRPLRLCPVDLRWEFEEPETLRLGFALPSGAYATTVLRELIGSGFSDD